MKKHVLGSWSVEDFIRSCWQKEPLLIPAALPEVQGLLDKKDLLALACQRDADARLICTDSKEKDWRCEQGPFKASHFKQGHFKSLAGTHWTLLVQAVDQYLPAVAELLPHFDFLPRWRLDDIMVSYATVGGGVGPHFDYYDVFLLQASGTRRWQLGQRCDHHSPLRDHQDMKLLKQFKQQATYDLGTGDMLYIPAGVAHWGTATSDDCITISIGFRAASQRELIQMALDKIARHLPESERYRDTVDAIDSDPFCINRHAVDNIQQFWQQLDAEKIKESLAQAFGEYSTEPRNPDHIHNDKTFTTLHLAKLPRLQHNPASRFAYRALDSKKAELYVDGETHPTSLQLAQAICHLKLTPSLLKTQADKQLLLTLLNQGSLLL
jgi:50S ribosomal protein L16 3-hydroxylase